MGIFSFLENRKGGGGNKMFLVVGTGIAGLLAYLFIAPMLVEKVSVPAAPVAIPAAKSQVTPAIVPAEQGATFSGIPLSNPMGKVPLAGRAYSYADVGLSDHFPYRFRLSVA